MPDGPFPRHKVFFRFFCAGQPLREIVARAVDGSGLSGEDVLYAAGSVRSSDNAVGEVSRINPRTNYVTKRIETGHGPSGFVFAAGSVWVEHGR